MTCPNCGEPLSERGSFCKFCGGQARCIHCKALLEPQAAACVECGTRIGNDSNSSISPLRQPTTANPGLPANRNTFSFREDRNSRSFDASFTDTTTQGLGEIFGDFFSPRVGNRSSHSPSRFFAREQPAVDITKSLPPAQDGGYPIQEPPPNAAPQDDHFSAINEIFKPNGDALELVERRLKAKTGMEHVRRLTYLCLYAHELYKREWTPRVDVISILKEGKVWDSNASRWLSKGQGFRVDQEDRLQLIKAGRDEAKKALGEINDPKISEGFDPDKRVPHKRPPRKKKD